MFSYPTIIHENVAKIYVKPVSIFLLARCFNCDLAVFEQIYKYFIVLQVYQCLILFWAFKSTSCVHITVQNGCSVMDLGLCEFLWSHQHDTTVISHMVFTTQLIGSKHCIFPAEQLPLTWER